MLTTDYKFGEVKNLSSQISVNPDKVDFRGIFQNANGGVTLLAFKAGDKLSEHTAPAEVMVVVLEGAINFKMADRKHAIHAGEFLLMGADVRHSVEAVENSKVMLVKVKP